MRSVVVFFIAIVLCLSSAFSSAQDNLFPEWFKMVSATQAEQPHWIAPPATTTPRREREFRYDIQWRAHNSGVVTDNYGVREGQEIIPAKNVAVIFAVPPYVVNNPDSPNGFGDWQFLVKYRMAAGNEQHGNDILTAFFQMSFATGQYEQGALGQYERGALSPVITPTIAYGKGYKDFDLQGTFGIQPAHRKRGRHCTQPDLEQHASISNLQENLAGERNQLHQLLPG